MPRLHIKPTHLHCLSVRYPTVNRYLRHCLSSCCCATRSTASVTTTTAAATTMTTDSRSGSSSSSSIRGTTTAGSCGAGGGGGGGGGPGAVGRGGRGPWLALHGALCSSHLWPAALLNGSPVPEEGRRRAHEKKRAQYPPSLPQTKENKRFQDGKLQQSRKETSVGETKICTAQRQGNVSSAKHQFIWCDNEIIPEEEVSASVSGIKHLEELQLKIIFIISESADGLICPSKDIQFKIIYNKEKLLWDAGIRECFAVFAWKMTKTTIDSISSSAFFYQAQKSVWPSKQSFHFCSLNKETPKALFRPNQGHSDK